MRIIAGLMPSAFLMLIKWSGKYLGIMRNGMGQTPESIEGSRQLLELHCSLSLLRLTQQPLPCSVSGPVCQL